MTTVYGWPYQSRLASPRLLDWIDDVIPDTDPPITEGDYLQDQLGEIAWAAVLKVHKGRA